MIPLLRRVPLAAVLLVGCLSSPSAEEAPRDSESSETAIADTTTPRADTEATDSAEEDTALADSEGADTTTIDSATADSVTAEVALTDSASADTTALDTTTTPDTATTDTTAPDTATADTAVVDSGADTSVLADCSTPPSVSTKWYATLSTARFYNTGSSGSIRSCFVEFTPAYELWSDGLSKRRWIYLPPGTKIETGPNPSSGAAPNMDRWVFPVGTRFFKEFARATDGKKVELRIWERTATGYRYGSFKWRADQSDADYTESGGPAALLLDDNTTTHEIPTRAECAKCHDGEPGKGLGFSAVQLSKPASSPGAPTLLSIAAKGWLSHTPTTWPNPTLGSPIPGTTVEATGLGYLHANCGHCHNPAGVGGAADMTLRSTYGETNARTGVVYTDTVSVLSKSWNKYGVTFRIDPGTSAPGDGLPLKSAVYMRPTFRGSNDQMPPLGTAIVDTTGLRGLEAFIKSL